MLKLTDFLETELDYNGQIVHVDLSFDNILRLFELFNDKNIQNAVKVDIACEMLISEYKLIEEADIHEKNELLLFILREYLYIDLTAEQSEGKDQGNEQGQSFDFTKDAGIIYASFMSVYGIDLFEMQGKLHFLKFMELLKHIDDTSKLKEVIHIRTTPLPSPNKHNQAERERLMKLKEVYSLDDELTEEQQQEKLNKQFSALSSFFKK